MKLVYDIVITGHGVLVLPMPGRDDKLAPTEAIGIETVLRNKLHQHLLTLTEELGIQTTGVLVLNLKEAAP